MAEYREIVDECSAYTFPSHDAPVTATLAVGTVVRVVRDDDPRFFRAAIEGQPLYVLKRCAAPTSEDAFFAYQATGQRIEITDRPRPPTRGTLATYQAPAEPVRLTDPIAVRDEPRVEYAGFGDRFGATVVDFILAAVASSTLSVMLLVSGVSSEFQLWARGLFVLALAVHFVLLTAVGGSWGHRLVGIRIINEKSGEPPGIGRAILRHLVGILSGLPLYLGYFWMIWDKRKRTWQDMAAGTIVVESDWHSESLGQGASHG